MDWGFRLAVKGVWVESSSRVCCLTSGVVIRNLMMLQTYKPFLARCQAV